MNRCNECAFFKQSDEVRGICTITKRGSAVRRGKIPSCKRFIAGKWEEDIKLKIIMNRLAAGYKGGRWG